MLKLQLDIKLDSMAGVTPEATEEEKEKRLKFLVKCNISLNGMLNTMSPSPDSDATPVAKRQAELEFLKSYFNRELKMMPQSTENHVAMDSPFLNCYRFLNTILVSGAFQHHIAFLVSQFSLSTLFRLFYIPKALIVVMLLVRRSHNFFLKSLKSNYKPPNFVLNTLLVQ